MCLELNRSLKKNTPLCLRLLSSHEKSPHKNISKALIDIFLIRRLLSPRSFVLPPHACVCECVFASTFSVPSDSCLNRCCPQGEAVSLTTDSKAQSPLHLSKHSVCISMLYVLCILLVYK